MKKTALLTAGLLALLLCSGCAGNSSTESESEAPPTPTERSIDLSAVYAAMKSTMNAKDTEGMLKEGVLVGNYLEEYDYIGLSADGRTLRIDTSPYDIDLQKMYDDGDVKTKTASILLRSSERYAEEALGCVMDEIGIQDPLRSKIGKVGMENCENHDSIANVEITWKYAADIGLEVTFVSS